MLRPPAVLLDIPRRFRSRFHSHGEGTEFISQPHEDLGHLRTSHVLPQI